ncbi:MAG: hypothetical protein QM740_17785 [Acidovorax sp.]
MKQWKNHEIYHEVYRSGIYAVKYTACCSAVFAFAVGGAALAANSALEQLRPLIFWAEKNQSVPVNKVSPITLVCTPKS